MVAGLLAGHGAAVGVPVAVGVAVGVPGRGVQAAGLVGDAVAVPVDRVAVLIRARVDGRVRVVAVAVVRELVGRQRQAQTGALRAAVAVFVGIGVQIRAAVGAFVVAVAVAVVVGLGVAVLGAARVDLRVQIVAVLARGAGVVVLVRGVVAVQVHVEVRVPGTVAVVPVVPGLRASGEDLARGERRQVVEGLIHRVRVVGAVADVAVEEEGRVVPGLGAEQVVGVEQPAVAVLVPVVPVAGLIDAVVPDLLDGRIREAQCVGVVAVLGDVVPAAVQTGGEAVAVGVVVGPRGHRAVPGLGVRAVLVGAVVPGLVGARVGLRRVDAARVRRVAGVAVEAVLAEEPVAVRVEGGAPLVGVLVEVVVSGAVGVDCVVPGVHRAGVDLPGGGLDPPQARDHPEVRRDGLGVVPAVVTAEDRGDVAVFVGVAVVAVAVLVDAVVPELGRRRVHARVDVGAVPVLDGPAVAVPVLRGGPERHAADQQGDQGDHRAPTSATIAT